MARTLRDIVFRSVAGIVNYHPDWQAAMPYPDFVHDPSLGLPHLFYQIQSLTGGLALIAPEPYHTERFVVPPWITSRG